jgi:hypothetical protein
MRRDKSQQAACSLTAWGGGGLEAEVVGMRVMASAVSTATNQTMIDRRASECTGNAGMLVEAGTAQGSGRAGQAGCEGSCNIPKPQRTDAESAILTAVVAVWRVWRREVVLVGGAAGFSAALDSRQAAAKGLTETGEPRTPRSAVRPKMASFSQTACPYKVSALSTPLAGKSGRAQ